MSDAPERIWLQWYGPNHAETGYTLEGDTGDLSTWCADKINDTDVEYVLADTVNVLRQRIAELEAQLAQTWQPVEDSEYMDAWGNLFYVENGGQTFSPDSHRSIDFADTLRLCKRSD